jgi:putative FmdB family regulatory protein
MTYEYLCESCGHEWEVDQSIKDLPKKKCPKCKKLKAKRLISKNGSFILTGSGWSNSGYS